MKHLLLGQLTVAFIVFLSVSCQKDLLSKQENLNDVKFEAQGKNGKGKTKTFFGPAVRMKHGEGRAWVTLDEEGVPLTLGVSLDAKAALSQGDEDKTYTLR